jgi:uncharacterized protein YjbJ (UPF0337 family)
MSARGRLVLYQMYSETHRAPSAIEARAFAPYWRNLTPTDAVGELRRTEKVLGHEHRPDERGLEAIRWKGKTEVGQLTSNDWQVVEGRLDQFIGKILERCGITREEAERQLTLM